MKEWEPAIDRNRGEMVFTSQDKIKKQEVRLSFADFRSGREMQAAADKLEKE